MSIGKDDETNCIKMMRNTGVIMPSASGHNRIFLSNLKNILGSFSNDVYVIAGNAEPTNHDKFEIISIRHEKGKNILGSIFNHINLQLKISSQIARLSNNVDVWIFFLWGEMLLLPILTSKLHRVKVVLALAGNSDKELRNDRIIFRVPARLLKIINLFLSDKIILYSERLITDWKLEKFRTKICIAHEQFINQSTFNVQVKLSNRNNQIGYIGRLSNEKGILNFLEGIPQVFQRNKNLQFLIIGDGSLRNMVEDFIIKRNLGNIIDYIGFISHDEIPNYLNKLKLVVIPSFTEGIPNLALEAMACGTPVLATPVGAIPDIIRDEVTGFIMENNQPECIAKNIIRALEYPDLEQITNNAHDFIKNEFSYDTATERYRKALENV